MLILKTKIYFTITAIDITIYNKKLSGKLVYHKQLMESNKIHLLIKICTTKIYAY